MEATRPEQSGRGGSLDHDREDGQPFKRKRLTLACLPCKRRKARCSKTKPCTTCVLREEGDKCEYDDGLSLSSRQQLVTWDDYAALQARLDKVEHILGIPKQEERTSSPSLPPVPRIDRGGRPNHAGPSRREDNKDLNELEDAANTLEELAVAGTQQGSVANSPWTGNDQDHELNHSSNHPGPSKYREHPQSLVPAQKEPQRWPNISCPPGSMKTGNRKWERDMSEIMDVIPSSKVILCLVNEFFLETHRTWHCLHEQLFREELRQFITLRRMPNFICDPAWLSLLCSVLCTATIDIQDNMPSLSASPMELQSADLNQLGRELLAASDTAMLCANWVSRPQLRILYSWLVRATRSVDIEILIGEIPGASQTTITGNVSGIIKLLELNRLGTDPNKMPPDDPMLPPGKSTMKRQLGVRAFNKAFFLDTFSEFRHGMKRCSLSYSFVEGSFNTESAQNFYETMDTVSIQTPAPLDVYTEGTWDVHLERIARSWRRTSEDVTKKGTTTYEMMLSRDAELREQHQELLDLKFDKVLGDDTSYSMLDCGYNQRFLNLHRPFLIRSYRESRYVYSQKSCVESALRITKIHRAIAFRPGLKAWYLYNHHLTAITVLFIHALHTPNEVTRVKTELQASLALFEKSKLAKIPSIVRASGKGDNIILAMLQMLNSPERNLKSVERIMKEVVRNASDSSRSRSNMALTSNVVSPTGPSPAGSSEGSNQVQQMFMFDDTETILRAIESSQTQAGILDWNAIAAMPPGDFGYDQNTLAMMLNFHAENYAAGNVPEPSIWNMSTF